MAGVAPIVPRFKFTNSAGVPLANGSVTVYLAGTTTLTNTWTNSAQTSLNTNPVSLNANGECVMWLDPALTYKFLLKDALGVTQWTDDNIRGFDIGLRGELAEEDGGALIGFVQTGTGAVPRTIQDKARESVTVKDFGAVGDGSADDTAAIQLALDTSAKHVHFPPGTYRITDSAQDGTPALISSLAGRHITCDGTITATSTVLKALGVTGADSTIRINVDGNLKIAHGVQVSASGCVVEGCRIEDLYTTTYSCIGIGTVDVNGGIIVRNNVLKNFTSVGDSTGANGNGLCRGVLLTGDADATSPSAVHDNYIENMLGEEADAITVISSNGAGIYYDADVTIRDNEIRNFTRRAIKVQASRTRIRGNYCRNSFGSSASVPNAQNVIALVQGGNHHVTDNILEGCKWFGQISCQPSVTPISDIYIERNRIIGVGSETSQAAIVVVTGGFDVVVQDNWVEHGTGRGLSLGETSRQVISGNTFIARDNTADPVISVSSSDNIIVRGNILMYGERQAFISIDAGKVIVRDNDVKSNTPLFRDALGDGNNLIINNSIDGTAGLVSDADSHTGNRFGPNFALGNQVNSYPGALYTINASGPTVALSGKYVQGGQIVFDTTPTPGNYIGWVATTSGLANVITWKQFGAILA